MLSCSGTVKEYSIHLYQMKKLEDVTVNWVTCLRDEGGKSSRSSVAPRLRDSINFEATTLPTAQLIYRLPDDM